MTLPQACILLTLLGVLAVVVGCALLWSIGVACIVGGVMVIVGAVALYDPKALHDARARK
ncbi:hypothetical protein [Gordonia sp. OPL2]|uniref:hypothetical protein n=1 Tax=Gordonia sp. OPL2 TaxID=2486274 RepID=UPI001655C5BA|nr:hypothetical protein [Gordonia sp. OPL2]ROZ89003.1 hypothetical protein EEB19_20045 [Gordonia sp. OPL2]